MKKSAKTTNTSLPPNDTKLSEADKVVVSDEASAQVREEVREGEKQAILERDRAKAAADEAFWEASYRFPDSPPEATKTFWQKFREFVGF